MRICSGLTPTVAVWFQTRARTYKNGILARQNAERQGWELFLDAPYAIPRLRQRADLVLRKVERWPDRVWEARLEEHLLLPRGRNVWYHLALAGDKLYVNGELVGGCDITLEMYRSGELKKLLDEAGATAG